MTTRLIVGLGNPGPKYAGNRHNVGFMVVDQLVSRYHASLREKFKGLLAKTTTSAGHEVVLLKPLTFMNLSGESVQRAMQFYKVKLADVIVVHDELDLDFGTLRVKVAGGSAGHNGLKSIVQHGGGNGFLRVRVGIGRPQKGRPESWVLGDFSKDQREALPSVLDDAERMIDVILADGPQEAMQRFHAKK